MALRNGAGGSGRAAKVDAVSATADTDARARPVAHARAPAGARSCSTRATRPSQPPPCASQDAAPAPEKMLLIVVSSKRTTNTCRLYARELPLFPAFCQRRGQALWAVR